MTQVYTYIIGGLGVLYFFSMVSNYRKKQKILKLKSSVGTWKESYEYEMRQKDALKRSYETATIANENQKEKLKAHIKLQSDMLSEHGIDLVLEEDAPWGSH